LSYHISSELTPKFFAFWKICTFVIILNFQNPHRVKFSGVMQHTCVQKNHIQIYVGNNYEIHCIPKPPHTFSNGVSGNSWFSFSVDKNKECVVVLVCGWFKAASQRLNYSFRKILRKKELAIRSRQFWYHNVRRICTIQ
jgi:hypothetical protein